MDMGTNIMQLCPFTPQLLLVLTAPTHGGMTQPELTGRLVLHQGGLPVTVKRSPAQALNRNCQACRDY